MPFPIESKMEYQDKVNKLLKMLLYIILLSLSVMLLVQIYNSSSHFGVHSERVVEILEYNFIEFFNTFREYSLDYMFFISIIMSFNVVAFLVVKLTKLSKPALFNFPIFVVSIIIAYQLPHADLYHRYFVDHKLILIISCLVMIIFAPYLVGRNLGWDPITESILGKLICVVVYGLLLAQMLIEIRI